MRAIGLLLPIALAPAALAAAPPRVCEQSVAAPFFTSLAFQRGLLAPSGGHLVICTTTSAARKVFSLGQRGVEGGGTHQGSPLARGGQAGGTQTERVDVRMDTQEAEAVLRLVERQRGGTAETTEEWEALFATPGYRQLEQRERSMGRSFERADFQTFVRSADLAARAAGLRQTIDRWTTADLSGAVARALAYLPPSTRIEATIFPVIKPRTNSFVFTKNPRPAIFLFIDPAQTREQFENTVAHELHHIGASSLEAAFEARLGPLTPGAREAAMWMGSFAEGIAMLAAAGGPSVHPHATSGAADRARWDKDEANFAADLRRVERFFLDVVQGQIQGDAVAAGGAAFFGVQGPWYTVGWRMSVLVEQAEGRAVVIDAVRDPRLLLVAYNRVARARHGELPLWSSELLAAVGM